MASEHLQTPSVIQIREQTTQILGLTPCIGQINAALAQLNKKTDVIFISSTGSGKTLTFWIPMLYEPDSITILITPLNVLGQQTSDRLTQAGIRAVNITAANVTDQTFERMRHGDSRLYVISPELLCQDRHFDDLWRDTKWTGRLARVIFDEAHCVSQWGGSFRPEYGMLDRVRYLVPHWVQFYLVSATLPPTILHDVRERLKLRVDTQIIRRSVDRWNCALVVRPMKHPIGSLKDLDFIIPPNWHEAGKLTHKFLIFFNSRKETEAAGEYLRHRLGHTNRGRVVWFHAIMSDIFREDSVQDFMSEKLWGLTCTDAAGMGLDISNITLVVQWRVPSSLCMLMQRFGRAARDLSKQGVCILIAEPSALHEGNDQGVGGDVGVGQGAGGGGPVQSTLGQEDVVIGETYGRRARNNFARPKTRNEEEVETAMSEFVNAHRLSVPCRRKVVTEYFQENLIDPEPDCCDRCKRQVPTLCCDLCNPELNEMFTPAHESSPEIGNEGVEVDGRCKVRRYTTKPYEPRAVDIRLGKELRDWRTWVYDDHYAGLDSAGLGVGVVVSNKVLQRIVDLAHYGKVQTEADVCDQTGWTDHLGLSPEILEIVRGTHGRGAPGLFTSLPRPSGIVGSPRTHGTPRTPRAAAVDHTPGRSTSASRKRMQCGACGQLGHNARNKDCPLRRTSSLPEINNGEIRGFSGVNLSNAMSAMAGLRGSSVDIVSSVTNDENRPAITFHADEASLLDQMGDTGNRDSHVL